MAVRIMALQIREVRFGGNRAERVRQFSAGFVSDSPASGGARDLPSGGQAAEARGPGVGFEVSQDEYVVMEQSDLDKIAPKTAKLMDILEFVKAGYFDPVFLDHREHIVVIRRDGNELMLDTMFFANEIRQAELKPRAA
jgi:hypothetical protein